MLPADVIALAKSTNVFDLIDADTTLRGGPTEKTGACPRCGGKDRLHVNIKHNAWFCRQCTGEPSTNGWKDAIDYVMFRSGIGFVDAVKLLTNGHSHLTQAERIELAKQRAEREALQERQDQEWQRKQRAKLWALDPAPWTKYHKAMTQDQRQAWYDRGLDDAWINYYQVGYATDLTFPRSGGDWAGDCLTIPIMRTLNSGKVTAISVICRLIGEDQDKYRPIMSGLGKQIYVPRYRANKLEGTALVVEGEIKAMVTYAYTKGLTTHVIGLAGKSPKQAHITALQSFDQVYICLDPDAKQDAQDLAWRIGPDKSRIIDLPGKIDDLLIDHTLTQQDLLHLITNSRRV